jgi:hypothetical protein
MEAYDTQSGDLELGDYAQEADASYISNIPAYAYMDATPSVPIAAHIAMSKTEPTLAVVTTSAPPPAPSTSTSTTAATGASATSATQ